VVPSDMVWTTSALTALDLSSVTWPFASTMITVSDFTVGSAINPVCSKE